MPQKTLFEYLIKLGINPDHPDYDEVTPFNLMSKKGINKGDEQQRHMFDKFLDMEVRIDHPDRKGRTPFLNFYEQ